MVSSLPWPSWLFGFKPHGTGQLHGLIGVLDGRAWDSAYFHQNVVEPVTRPGRREVDHLPLVVNGEAAIVHGHGHRAEKLFRQAHELLKRCIGLVEFEHGELRIMLGGNAFIPEVAIQFKDPLESSYQQTLEIELRSNTQEQFHPESIMESLERFCRGAAGDRLHHRRFHFQKAPIHEELAHGLDNLRASFEGFSNGIIDDKINITLPITELDVFQPMILFGKRAQILAEKNHLFGEQRELVGAGSKERPLDADDISDIKLFGEAVALFVQLVLLEVDSEAFCPESRRCMKMDLPKERIATIRPATV